MYTSFRYRCVFHLASIAAGSTATIVVCSFVCLFQSFFCVSRFVKLYPPENANSSCDKIVKSRPLFYFENNFLKQKCILFSAECVFLSCKFYKAMTPEPSTIRKQTQTHTHTHTCIGRKRWRERDQHLHVKSLKNVKFK